MDKIILKPCPFCGRMPKVRYRAFGCCGAWVEVRCKGCEHAERYERTDGTAGYYCGHPQNTFVFGDRWDRVFKPVKKPDDFCSYGLRKNKSADVRNMEHFAGGGKTGGPNDADQH